MWIWRPFQEVLENIFTNRLYLKISIYSRGKSWGHIPNSPNSVHIGLNVKEFLCVQVTDFSSYIKQVLSILTRKPNNNNLIQTSIVINGNGCCEVRLWRDGEHLWYWYEFLIRFYVCIVVDFHESRSSKEKQKFANFSRKLSTIFPKIYPFPKIVRERRNKNRINVDSSMFLQSMKKHQICKSCALTP